MVIWFQGARLPQDATGNVCTLDIRDAEERLAKWNPCVDRKLGAETRFKRKRKMCFYLHCAPWRGADDKEKVWKDTG